MDFAGLNADQDRLSRVKIDSSLTCVRSFHTNQRVTYNRDLKAAGFQGVSRALHPPRQVQYEPVSRVSRGVTMVRGDSRTRDGRDPKGQLTTSRKVTTTDTSLRGWGDTHKGRSAGGV